MRGTPSGFLHFRLKHKGPPGGASGPFAFKSRLLSRDATGGGSSRPEALDQYGIKRGYALQKCNRVLRISLLYSQEISFPAVLHPNHSRAPRV